MNKETIEKQMHEILAELSSLYDYKVDEDALKTIYRDAAWQLDIADGENNDGEMDIYETTYRLGNEYYDLKDQLKEVK